jgi:hypothetical protein
MAGHSRPKDGVLSPAYVPAIHVFNEEVDWHKAYAWLVLGPAKAGPECRA